jgi:hypothetical protein
MGHYLRKCPKVPTLSTKENVCCFILRFSIEENKKAQIHLIESINEGRENALMGLEKRLKILEDVINVTAKTKQLVEDIIHPDVNVERLKKMAKAPKENKKN